MRKKLGGIENGRERNLLVELTSQRVGIGRNEERHYFKGFVENENISGLGIDSRNVSCLIVVAKKYVLCVNH